MMVLISTQNRALSAAKVSPPKIGKRYPLKSLTCFGVGLKRLNIQGVRLNASLMRKLSKKVNIISVVSLGSPKTTVPVRTFTMWYYDTAHFLCGLRSQKW